MIQLKFFMGSYFIFNLGAYVLLGGKSASSPLMLFGE